LGRKEFRRVLEDLGYEVVKQKKYSMQASQRWKSTTTTEKNWATVYGLGLKRFDGLRLEAKDERTVVTAWN
jgi:hypothetical protein